MTRELKTHFLHSAWPHPTYTCKRTINTCELAFYFNAAASAIMIIFKISFTSHDVTFGAPARAAIIDSRPVPAPMSSTCGTRPLAFTASTAYCRPKSYFLFWRKRSTLSNTNTSTRRRTLSVSCSMSPYCDLSGICLLSLSHTSASKSYLASSGERSQSSSSMSLFCTTHSALPVVGLQRLTNMFPSNTRGWAARVGGTSVKALVELK